MSRYGRPEWEVVLILALALGLLLWVGWTVR